jgi:cell division protein FtsX
MSTDISIADIVVHLHPDASDECKSNIENGLRAHDGVVSVHFDSEDHPHAVVVAYNPDAVDSGALLTEIRKCDKDAMMAGI